MEQSRESLRVEIKKKFLALLQSTVEYLNGHILKGICCVNIITFAPANRVLTGFNSFKR